MSEQSNTEQRASEPHIPGTNDPGEPTAKLTVEVVQRRTIEIDVFIPYEEAWRRREELAAPFLNDEAGEPLGTAVHYSIEGKRWQRSEVCPKCEQPRGGGNDDDAGCNRHSPMEPWQEQEARS